MKPFIHFDQLTKKFGAHTAVDRLSGRWEAGSSVGIVGANGAGKSTLLRLLSGISSPTSGTLKISGRLASLLEVGTGFHPELTGRENIFLYGQILGLRRAEIRAQLDAIADFSGVSAQLDLPLKHFSSGQKIRLGFSVAAQLRSDIILLDEVLGVGDAAFQQQSFERMQSLLSEEGRMAVVVSHHLGTIRRMCTQALWIDAGRERHSGPVADVLEAYKNAHASSENTGTLPNNSWVASVRWSGTLVAGQPARLEVALNNNSPLQRPNLRLTLFNQHGEFLAPLSPVTSGLGSDWWPERAQIALEFDRLPLMRGSYHLGLRLTENDLELVHLPIALPFAVEEGLYFPNGDTFAPRFNGLWLDPQWTVASSDPA